MSRAWTWRHAILASRLPATTKHVLMVISAHMNDLGEGCFPSVKRLAEAASLSERAVCTHIEEARKAGWLAVGEHGFAGQGWARHEYRPLWPEGTEHGSAPPPEKGTEPPSEGTEPDDKKALNVVQSNIPMNISEGISQDEKPKTKASTRATVAKRIEDIFDGESICPAEWANWASTNHGWSQQQIDAAFIEFVRYWRAESGQRARKLNWYATWQNRCVVVAERQAQNGRRSGPAGGGAGGGLTAALHASLAQRSRVSPAGGGISGGNAPGATGEDAGAGGLGTGERPIPF